MSPARIEMQLLYSIGPSFQLELRCRGSHSFRSTAAPYCCESITLHLASRSHVRSCEGDAKRSNMLAQGAPTASEHRENYTSLDGTAQRSLHR
ncbi:unnamed protein product, partial [Ixodes pacificus]